MADRLESYLRLRKQADYDQLAEWRALESTPTAQERRQREQAQRAAEGAATIAKDRQAAADKTARRAQVRHTPLPQLDMPKAFQWGKAKDGHVTMPAALGTPQFSFYDTLHNPDKAALARAYSERDYTIEDKDFRDYLAANGRADWASSRLFDSSKWTFGNYLPYRSAGDPASRLKFEQRRFSSLVNDKVKAARAAAGAGKPVDWGKVVADIDAELGRGVHTLPYAQEEMDELTDAKYKDMMSYLRGTLKQSFGPHRDRRNWADMHDSRLFKHMLQQDPGFYDAFLSRQRTKFGAMPDSPEKAATMQALGRMLQTSGRGATQGAVDASQQYVVARSAIDGLSSGPLDWLARTVGYILPGEVKTFSDLGGESMQQAKEELAAMVSMLPPDVQRQALRDAQAQSVAAYIGGAALNTYLTGKALRGTSSNLVLRQAHVGSPFVYHGTQSALIGAGLMQAEDVGAGLRNAGQVPGIDPVFQFMPGSYHEHPVPELVGAFGFGGLGGVFGKFIPKTVTENSLWRWTVGALAPWKLSNIGRDTGRTVASTVSAVKADPENARSIVEENVKGVAARAVASAVANPITSTAWALGSPLFNSPIDPAGDVPQRTRLQWVNTFVYDMMVAAQRGAEAGVDPMVAQRDMVHRELTSGGPGGTPGKAASRLTSVNVPGSQLVYSSPDLGQKDAAAAFNASLLHFSRQISPNDELSWDKTWRWPTMGLTAMVTGDLDAASRVGSALGMWTSDKAEVMRDALLFAKPRSYQVQGPDGAVYTVEEPTPADHFVGYVGRLVQDAIKGGGKTELGQGDLKPLKDVLDLLSNNQLDEMLRPLADRHLITDEEFKEAIPRMLETAGGEGTLPPRLLQALVRVGAPAVVERGAVPEVIRALAARQNREAIKGANEAAQKAANPASATATKRGLPQGWPDPKAVGEQIVADDETIENVFKLRFGDKAAGSLTKEEKDWGFQVLATALNKNPNKVLTTVLSRVNEKGGEMPVELLQDFLLSQKGKFGDVVAKLDDKTITALAANSGDGKLWKSDDPEKSKQLQEIKGELEDQLQGRVWELVKEDAFERLPWVAALFAHRQGWSTLAEYLGDPVYFYGALLLILGGGAIALFAGGDDDDDKGDRRNEMQAGAGVPVNFSNAF